MQFSTWHKLTLFILLLPTAEFFLLVKIGGIIGPFPTLFIVVGTAATGAYLLRQQGLLAWHRLRECLRRGDPPTAEIIDGAFVLIGGLMLLTPGIFTDLFGITCIWPLTRRYYIRFLTDHGFFDLLPGVTKREDKVIEGSYEREN